ncbi:MAG TPA: phage terminase large subunit, partial [Chloroflexota bacterium]
VNTVDHYARRVLAGWTFRGVRSTGPKELRANPVSSAAEAGNVLLVRGAWIGAFLDEAEAFPGGAHDDQVDAVSGAVAMLTRKRELTFL